MAAGAGLKTCSIFINSSPELYAPRGDDHKIILANNTDFVEKVIDAIHPFVCFSS